MGRSTGYAGAPPGARALAPYVGLQRRVIRRPLSRPQTGPEAQTHAADVSDGPPLRSHSPGAQSRPTGGAGGQETDQRIEPARLARPVGGRPAGAGDPMPTTTASAGASRARQTADATRDLARRSITDDRSAALS